MGKMGASSWLSAVKKVLSPTKGSERRGEHEEEDHKGFLQKRGKKRWIFRKPSPYNIASSCNSKTTRRKSTDQQTLGLRLPVFEEVTFPEQRQTMAVAVATTATAESVVATVQAAVKVIRLDTPSIIVDENYAAVSIQTAFRGYLARRALKAIKGVVQLQAFVRGYNVRERAKMTLQCMQSLLWVQNQVCDQRKRLSLSPLKHLYQLAETKSKSRSSTSSITDNEYRPHKSKEDNLKRENSLAHAFSRQIWRSENSTERTKTTEIATSARHSLSSPLHATARNLLINSLSSPHRSRTRVPKTQPTIFEDSPPPRYMTETESAAARVRSKSAPRQRLERERESGLRSAKKRLNFAVMDLYSGV